MSERENAFGPWLRTSVGRSQPDRITVRGHDLAADLMGRVSFGDVAFLLVAARLPSPGESRVFNAVLVALADHGITPTVLAARLTHTGAPESLQGAMAAGLLGAGSVFLGVVEDTARFLGEVLAGHRPLQDDADAERLAVAAVRAAVAAGRRVPGLGHPVHRVEDPRTPRLHAIAEEEGLAGDHLRLLRAVGAAWEAERGRPLPVNGAGVCGAALADLGFRWQVIRGFALVARSAGLLGHLAEEMEDPIGMRLWQQVEHDVEYRPDGGAAT